MNLFFFKILLNNFLLKISFILIEGKLILNIWILLQQIWFLIIWQIINWILMFLNFLYIPWSTGHWLYSTTRTVVIIEFVRIFKFSYLKFIFFIIIFCRTCLIIQYFFFFYLSLVNIFWIWLKLLNFDIICKSWCISSIKLCHNIKLLIFIFLI